MDPRAAHARRMFRQNVRRNGAPATFVRVTRGTPPTAAVNPPAYLNVVVDGVHTVGATSLKLRADRLVGRFLTGDVLTVTGQPLMYVSAETMVPEDVLLSGLYGVTLPLQASLTVGLADGVPVILAFAAETKGKALVGNFSRSLVDGQMVRSTDLKIIFAAMDLAVVPRPQDIVQVSALDGSSPRDRVVLDDARVNHEKGVPVSYEVQVR